MYLRHAVAAADSLLGSRHDDLGRRVYLLFASCLGNSLKLIQMVDGLFYLGVLLVKIDVVPNQENIHRPNAAAVVLPAAEMLVQPRYQSVGVEELFGGLALEFFLDYVVELFVTQPYAGGHGEAELLLFGGGLGHMPDRRLAHGVLGVVLVDPEVGRQRGRHLEHLFVQEGHAQLKRVSHAHAVRLEQDVADHPKVDVEVLHLGYVVVLAAAVVILARLCLRSGGDGGVFKKGLLLLEVVHEGVADVALLQLVAGADEIVASLDVGQLAGYSAQRFAQKMRDYLLIYSKNSRVVVAGVAAEQLVGALARKDDLYIAAGKARYKVQRDAGGVGERLIHVILHGGHRVPELLA